MKRLIAANWKMHGTRADIRAWVPAVAAQAATLPNVDAVLCPPAPLLAAAKEAGAPALGGQDCHAETKGAHTGDISANMLKEAGCAYVIVGHSERRAAYNETNAQVRAKAKAALATGLTPIICVGETLAQREAGQAQTVLSAQLRGSLPESGNFVIAYEPIWAIGTGKTAGSADIAAMHAHIAAHAPKARILYGGSVKAANAAEILHTHGVHGALVGGASLNAEEFCAILRAAQ